MTIIKTWYPHGCHVNHHNRRACAEAVCACLRRLADQMRLMTFPQWFDLLQSIFSSFLLFLQRAKVSRLLSTLTRPL